MLISVMCFFAVLTADAQYSEDDLLKEANALFDQGKYADAMPLYSQLLSLNPTKPEFNYKYGATALYGDADKKEEAIKFLRYASTKTGIDNKCWYFLGRAYHLNYQFADALQAYNKFKVLAGTKGSEGLDLERQIEDCRNGQNLLSKIKEVKVLDKKQSTQDAFFRIYDLNDIGGRILVTPDELLSPLDKKLNHKSLIHFRGTGTTVYFSSYGKDGKNGLDIYRAEVLPGGSFSTPQALGPTINSPYDEDYPFMHPDNSTFYFSSKGHSSMGGYDIFKSSFAGGSFTNPENLDFAINTPDDDLFYIADSLKNMAYFASARSSKQGQLHVYKVMVSSVPADITFVKGNFSNQILLNNKLAKITVVDASTNQEVDVQYTDPQSGDYVLSFPRSGRYKLSVEAEKSDRIHAGIVEIPKSSGIKAYLQEMELVSSAGVEKLLINNLFDQQYDGDVAELAQKMLRQRAALDVNFNSQQDDAPAPVTDDKVDNIAMAYNAAGFGAGLSNEVVLAEAEKRKSDLTAKKDKINDLKLAAQQHYFEAVAEANVQSAEAKDLIEQAAQLPEEKRGELMFKAGVAKMEAQNALRIADNTHKLINELSKLENRTQEAEVTADNQAKALDAALKSGDYNTALEALKAEKAIQEKQDRTARDFDAVTQLQLTSVESRNDAQKFLDRASSIRSQAEEAQTKLHNKTRQREKLKGKEAKELDAEIVTLTAEANDAKNRATKAFEQAAKVQEESFDKKQQFDILSEINEEVKKPDYQAPKTASVSASNSAALASLKSEVSNLDIDAGQISAYLKANPQAASGFESDEYAMAFKRAYAIEGVQIGGETASDLALNETETEEIAGDFSSENPTSTTEISDVAIANQQSEESIDGNQNEIDQRYETPSTATSTETDSQSSESDLAEENSQSESEQDEEEVSAETGMDAPEATFAEAETNSSNQTDNTTDSEALASESAAKASETMAISESAQNEIAAENVKIEAAEDWIAIIDASIADLKRGVGGEEGENINDQLEQYQALKDTKQKEIAQSRAKISELSGEVPAADPVDNLADSGSNSAEAATALARAEMDLDSLSVSHIARLEMKMVDAYSDKSYEKKISDIDAEYLAEMESVELSGKSDPEIAAARRELNTRFIESLDQLISIENTTKLKTDDLVELRRIKGLEIRRDKLIETGEMAYKPQTAKALEYQAMMSEPVSDDSTLADQPETDESLVGLSPEFAEELMTPFSRSLVVDQYDAELQKIESADRSEAQFAKRIALNKSYLNSLQAEIQMYSAALQAEENPKNASLIQERYDILLSERSAVVDEIDADQKEMNTLADAKRADAQEPLEVFIDSEPDEVAQNDGNVLAEMHTTNYVKNIEQSFINQLNAIESEELTEKERLEKSAELNAETALEIDSIMGVLVAKLDNPTRSVNPDSLQIQIQLLDAIAADKRQEADRLSTEVEMLTIAEEATSIADATNQNDAVAENVNLPENSVVVPNVEISELESAWAVQPEINSLKYKSLNANIASERMEPMIDSLSLLKNNARNLASALNASDDQSERAQNHTKLEQTQVLISDLQERLTGEISKSNAAEISYFRESNNSLINRLEDFGSGGEIEGEIKTYSSETADLNRSFADIEARFTRNEISEIERIELENDLIASMAQLNSRMESEVKNAEPEVISVEMVASELESDGAKPQPLLGLMMENPENYTPEPGKAYITPIHRVIETDLTESQKANLTNSDAELAVDYNFVLMPTPQSDAGLIQSATQIDDRGMDLLESNPEQLRYLLASLGADSLKRMELRQAAYAKQMDAESIEKFAEVKRLDGILVHEKNPKVKADLQNRRDRIIAEATVNYQKSTVATFQAEKLRNLRKEQEFEVVDAAADLKQDELAELNQLMNIESYTVVSTDLASAEMVKPKPAKPKQNATNQNNNVAAPAEVNASETSVTPEITSSTTSTESELSEATTDVMPINENLASIDEKLLLEAHGNWLNVFEVIADKTDFSDVQESLFVKSEGSVYSAAKPIPVDPVMPDGLVFQVQVGAYRNKIPQDLFGDFAPVMGQELPNGITRYRAGIFRAYKAAITARNQIRERGYSDAFVVAYIDGERLTGSQANEILEQSRVAEGLTVAETMVPALPGTAQQTGATGQSAATTASTTAPATTSAEAPRTDYYNDPEAASANLVEATTGLFYTVQVGVYSKPVKLDALFNLTELNSELTSNGYIRYTSGRYTSPETAALRKAEVIEKGVSDAFITAYYNGKRISVSKAQSIFEAEGGAVLSPAIGKTGPATKVDTPKTNSTEEKKDNVKYVVILGSYAGAVPQNVANVFLERSDLKIRRVTAPNGISIYASPEFESREEAEDFLKLSLAAGVNSAVMGKVVNGSISAVDAH